MRHVGCEPQPEMLKGQLSVLATEPKGPFCLMEGFVRWLARPKVTLSIWIRQGECMTKLLYLTTWNEKGLAHQNHPCNHSESINGTIQNIPHKRTVNFLTIACAAHHECKYSEHTAENMINNCLVSVVCC